MAESAYLNSDGTFKGGFDGCVRYQTDEKGLSEESAKKLCAYIGRAADKIDSSDEEIVHYDHIEHREGAKPWCVVSQDRSKTLGCFESREQAVHYLANVEAHKKDSNVEDVIRIDVGKLDKFEKTPSGGLRIPAVLTRAGVFTYKDQDGNSIRELRHPEDVFHPDSIKSLEDAPVTDLHPTGLVTPQTFKRDAVGHIRDVRRDGDKLVGTVVVQDASMIQAIEGGNRREISLGYHATREWATGDYKGEAFDARQRVIRYNHGGIGPRSWGRAGPEVQLRLDNKGENKMSVRIDGVDYDASSPQFAQAFENHQRKLQEEMDSLRRTVSEQKGRLDGADDTIAKITRERDTYKQERDRAISLDEISRRVDARVSLLRRAAPLLGGDYEVGNKTDQQIRLDALEKAGHKIPEGADENYVVGRFEAVTEMRKDDAEEKFDGVKLREMPDDEKNERKDGAERSLERIYRDNREFDEKAWQKPLDMSKGA